MKIILIRRHLRNKSTCVRVCTRRGTEEKVELDLGPVRYLTAAKCCVYRRRIRRIGRSAAALQVRASTAFSVYAVAPVDAIETTKLSNRRPPVVRTSVTVLRVTRETYRQRNRRVTEHGIRFPFVCLFVCFRIVTDAVSSRRCARSRCPLCP